MKWNLHADREHHSVAEFGRSVVSFKRQARSGEGESCTAMDLVGQAAQVLQSIEDHAAETTARAQNLVRHAAEKIQLSEQRISELQAAQNAAEAALQEANARADEAERTSRAAETQIAELEARVAAAEQRARNAETRMMQAEQSLVRIEDAIRTQLLNGRQGSMNRSRAA